MEESKFSNVIKSIGVSDISVTPGTAKMLQIQKAISYLYGEFLNEMENVYGKESFSSMENQLLDPFVSLDRKMKSEIAEVMFGNNVYALKIEI